MTEISFEEYEREHPMIPEQFMFEFLVCEFCMTSIRPLYQLIHGEGQAPWDPFGAMCEPCIRNLHDATAEVLDRIQHTRIES